MATTTMRIAAYYDGETTTFDVEVSDDIKGTARDQAALAAWLAYSARESEIEGEEYDDADDWSIVSAVTMGGFRVIHAVPYRGEDLILVV